MQSVMRISSACALFIAILAGVLFAGKSSTFIANNSDTIISLSYHSPMISDETLVFHKMNVLTMDDDSIHSKTSVVVEGDKIIWVGPSDLVEIPENAVVVEGDYYLMPGLAEMILLTTNPLENIPFNHAIEGVVMRGVYYDRSTLDGYLTEIRNRVASVE